MKLTETTIEAVVSLYEVAFMLKEETGLDRVKAILSHHGATIVAEQPITKAKLAYPIKKMTFAFFGIIRFNALPESITSITHNFGIEDGFLRHMIHAVKIKRTTEKQKGSESDQVRHQTFTRSTQHASPETMLTNADLEKKIEEISKVE